jgi:hypothetical protein
MNPAQLTFSHCGYVVSRPANMNPKPQKAKTGLQSDYFRNGALPLCSNYCFHR